MKLSILVLVSLLIGVSEEKAVKFFAIGVNGTLLCGRTPVPGIRVRLWDNDIGELADSPKHDSFTDFDGHIEFDDWTPSNEEPEPVIRIAHDCNDGNKPGQRLFKFRIPKSYVVDGKEAPKDMYFPLGTINLELKPYDEKRWREGEISKRSVFSASAHKLRVPRHLPRQEKEVVDTTEEKQLIRQPVVDSSSQSDESACGSGLCTFSGDRRRREVAAAAADDDVMKKGSSEEEGCTDGACPIDFSRKRRALAEQDGSTSDATDEIVEKIEEDNAHGCAEDGACPLHLTRKRRDEDAMPEEMEVDECGDCVVVGGKKEKKNATKPVSQFNGKDESPEDRIDPW